MTICVEGRSIGVGCDPFLIAELSANHDRNLDLALSLVDLAADAGWSALKLQTYSPDSLTMRTDHPSARASETWGAATLWDLYESAHMPMEFHEPLFSRARERGLLPFTSIYDPRDLDFIESLGNPIYKISSFEMTYDDLLRAVAETRKPIILSTGMATWEEVGHALDVLDFSGAADVIVLHCCSSYPAPLDEINLNLISEMQRRFNRSIGFSDHTIGSQAALAAISMGAVAIEKHFTDNTNRKGPDHRFSATPDVLKEIAKGAHEISLMRGSNEKSTTTKEEANKALCRRSAFAVRDLAAGTVVTDADFRFIRPGAGIPPTEGARLRGARLTRAVARGHPITWDDIEPGI